MEIVVPNAGCILLVAPKKAAPDACSRFWRFSDRTQALVESACFGRGVFLPPLGKVGGTGILPLGPTGVPPVMLW
jgi:hypothetical protein